MGKVQPKKPAASAKNTKAEPAKKPPASTAVATRPDAPSSLANVAEMMKFDVGAGLDNVRTEDLAVPRLAILHELSPACDKRGENYVDGAEPGMIIENVSNALYEGEAGVTLVLVHYRRAHLQWWPRNAKGGKGFIADHGADPSILTRTVKDEKTGASLLPDGSEIVITAEYMALLIDEETGLFERVLVPMAKTQFSKSKKLLTVATSLIAKETGKTAPLFYRSYRFSTVPEQNDKGHWYGWKITPGPFTMEIKNGMNIYLAARAFREGALAGQVKVQAPGETEHSGGSGGGAADQEEKPM